MLQLRLFTPGKRLRMAVTLTCQIAFVLIGYNQGLFSGIVGNTNFLSRMSLPSDLLLGFIVSLYNLGCFFGCILCFFFGEGLGRRQTILLSMFLITIGAVLQTTAYTVPHMIVGRFIAGVGTGFVSSTMPQYQAELCAAEKRGRLVATQPLVLVAGICVAYFFDYGMMHVKGEVAWRLPIACQILLAIPVCVLTLGLPESPRWLYKRGNEAAGRATIAALLGLPVDDPAVQAEETIILDAFAEEHQAGRFRWGALLHADDMFRTRKRLLLAYGVQFINQWGGSSVVAMFLPSVLEYNVGLSKNMSVLIGGVVMLMFPLGSLVPAIWLERISRVRPMMGGCVGLSVSMALIAALLSVGLPIASVTFFFTYVFIFGMTINSIPWVYVPEILPIHVRTEGSAIAMSGNWMWNFVIATVAPTLIQKLGWKTYAIFAATNLVFAGAIWAWYPETASLGLEEINGLFTNKGGEKRGVVVELKEVMGSAPASTNASTTVLAKEQEV